MMEKLQRLIAAAAGIVAISGWVHSTLTDPEPLAQGVPIIAFRLGWCALILGVFFRRAAGRKMEPVAWGFVALVVIPGVWEGKSLVRSVTAAIAGGLIVIAARIEFLLQQRTIRQRVQAPRSPMGDASGGVPVEMPLVRAEVIAVLNAATVRVVLAPGDGLADGGVHCDLPVELIAPPLRFPGTKLWVQMAAGSNILSTAPRDEQDKPWR
jgi:hypothetical protein